MILLNLDLLLLMKYEYMNRKSLYFLFPLLYVILHLLLGRATSNQLASGHLGQYDSAGAWYVRFAHHARFGGVYVAWRTG